MKASQIPSLILAAILQVVPLARIAATLQQPAAPLWAVIMRWAGAAAAALGGIQAVSGASTVITSPSTATGTNGVPFKQFRLTTAPDQAHYWTASGLPPGISLTGKSGQTFWALGGTPTSAGVFKVQITAKDQATSGADRTVSGTLTITIVGTGTPPTITEQPTSQTVSSGNPATFRVQATGTAPLAYQWRKDGALISGATLNAYTISSVVAADAGSYSVLVSNTSGNVLSQTATLTVNVPVSTPPTIVSEPQAKTVHAGQSVTFTVTASGTEPIEYQWLKGGLAIAGADGPTLELQGVDDAAAGEYSVRVTNAAGSIQSAGAMLTVTTLQILSIAQAADSTVITWNGIPGQNYLFFSVDAFGDTWQQLSDAGIPVLEGDRMKLVIPGSGGPLRFLRVSAYP